MNVVKTSKIASSSLNSRKRAREPVIFPPDSRVLSSQTSKPSHTFSATPTPSELMSHEGDSSVSSVVRGVEGVLLPDCSVLMGVSGSPHLPPVPPASPSSGVGEKKGGFEGNEFEQGACVAGPVDVATWFKQRKMNSEGNNSGGNGGHIQFVKCESGVGEGEGEVGEGKGKDAVAEEDVKKVGVVGEVVVGTGEACASGPEEEKPGVDCNVGMGPTLNISW